MTPQINSIIALLFLSIGAVAALLMLEVRGNPNKGAGIRKLITAHKIFGYLFVSIFVFMMVAMIQKVTLYQEELSPRAIIHIIMGIALLPMIFLKILIVRRHKSLAADLLGLGKTIFFAAFILTGITGGYYFLHRSDVRYISLSESDRAVLDDNIGRMLVQNKCAKCHTLERVFRSTKSKEGWTRTINRMAAMDEFNIRDFDIKQIIYFLVEQQKKRPGADEQRASLEIGKKLVGQKCILCHNLERVYNASKTEEAWLETVNRMIDTMGDKEFLKEDEKEQIIDYLAFKNKGP
jgi:mono/diheme cytochrome c family protein